MGENGQEKKTKKESLLPLLLPPKKESGIKKEHPPPHPHHQKDRRKRGRLQESTRERKTFSSQVTFKVALQAILAFCLAASCSTP